MGSNVPVQDKHTPACEYLHGSGRDTHTTVSEDASAPTQEGTSRTVRMIWERKKDEEGRRLNV